MIRTHLVGPAGVQLTWDSEPQNALGTLRLCGTYACHQRFRRMVALREIAICEDPFHTSRNDAQSADFWISR